MTRPLGGAQPSHTRPPSAASCAHVSDRCRTASARAGAAVLKGRRASDSDRTRRVGTWRMRHRCMVDAVHVRFAHSMLRACELRWQAVVHGRIAAAGGSDTKSEARRPHPFPGTTSERHVAWWRVASTLRFKVRLSNVVVDLECGARIGLHLRASASAAEPLHPRRRDRPTSKRKRRRHRCRRRRGCTTCGSQRKASLRGATRARMHPTRPPYPVAVRARYSHGVTRAKPSDSRRGGRTVGWVRHGMPA